MLKGVDVSHSNGNVDWATMGAAGDIQFAIIKASEGGTFNDPAFISNWQAVRAEGIARGAYHFARPSNNTPEAEADHFLAQIAAGGGLLSGDLLALDIEDTNVSATLNLHDWTLTWLQRVESQVRFKPLLYSGGWYMAPHGLTGTDDLANYTLWYSLYNYTFGSIPNPPANWSAIAIHQYSDQGVETGITGNVDLNCFTGNSIDDLRQYGSPDLANIPTVTGLNPNSGPAGTQVVITGNNFTRATDVGFGNTNVAQMNVDSGTQITATVPSGTGTVDVTVLGPGGASATNAADQFTYSDVPRTT